MTDNKNLFFSLKKKGGGCVVFDNDGKCIVVEVGEICNDSLEHLWFILQSFLY